jgi:gamma-glutamyl:cysteine ligase YbdK (ATP-grasp superfamily)
MAEAKGINPQITPEEVTEEVKEMATEVKEEVVVTTEQIVSEAKEGVIEAPSRIRQILGYLAAMGEHASVRSNVSGSDDVVVGSSLSGLYGAKFDALAKEHEQVTPRE